MSKLPIDPLGSAAGGPIQPVVRETLPDFIYRRFFKAGIFVVLTAGCTWGAVNLLEIGLAGSFLQMRLLPAIHAHAHAMVFGWVGLFVMGFAYQSFPRFKSTSLWKPKLAAFTLYLMLAGILTRITAELLQNGLLAMGLGGFSAAAEITAVSLFIVIIRKSARKAIEPRQLYERFLGAAMFWFWVQTALSHFFFFAKATAASTEELVLRIALIDGPLLSIQFLGFVPMMIAGVSLRMIPMAYGFRRPQRDWRRLIFWLMNGSLVLGVASYLALFTTRRVFFAAGLELAYVLTFAWAALLVEQLGIFSRPTTSDRGLKFIRAAYSWLLVATAMLPLVPLYNALTGQAFSHAYMGAHRHALTVGFVSMMILGVSSRIVPMLAGLRHDEVSALWGPFLLLNIGNALRVGLQILTDFVPWIAYPWVGFTGFVEVIGLFWWGVVMWRTMNLAKTTRARLFRAPIALESK
ncbi:MAG: NnrS family protein [Candidatus Acidiferrales bacterium]